MKNVKNKYWLKSGTYSMLSSFTNIAFGFGSFLILIRVLSKEEFGTWVLFLGIIGLLDMARAGLIQNAFIKYSVNANDENYAKIITSSLYINTIVTIVIITLLCISSSLISALFHAPKLENLFYIYAIISIATIFISQFNFVMQAKGDFRGIYFSNFSRQSVFFIGVVAIVFANSSIELFYLVILQLVGALIGVTVSYHFVKKFLCFSFKWDWYWIKKLFNYGKYVFGTAISSIILNNIDNMMLGYLLGVRSVAIYNIAYRISNFVEVPIGAIASVVFPKSVERNDNNGNNAIKYLYERSVGIIIAIVFPLSFSIFFFAKEIILAIAGTEYVESIIILQIVISFSILKPFLRMFGTTLDSIGKPDKNFFVIMFSVVINFTSNYILIILFGIMGAALGTLTTLLFCLIITKVILKRELDVGMLNAFIYAIQFYGIVIKGGAKLGKNLFSKFTFRNNNYVGE